MFSPMHKGIQTSLDLDTTNFTGDAIADAKLSYIQNLVAGRLVAIDSNGHAALADGLAANGLESIGFIVRDAAGEEYGNKAALASEKLTVSFGNQLIVTDQIDTDQTFAYGDALYAGTGALVGRITNVKAAGAKQIGIAMSEAGATKSTNELTILV